MPSLRGHRGLFASTFAVSLMLLLASAGQATASAKVRFIHAVPGAGAATVTVTADGSKKVTSATTFGNSSTPLEIGSGSVTFELKAASGGADLAKLTETVADGQMYTLVAIPKPDEDGVVLKLYENKKPRAGK